ncbi:RodZ domain-containing protein [Kangiella shandongensis]|uniref:RodZ domain-containing protein n=1 Tax=Kangiella shandongensis TaxID=2763258 RepID=UPI001CBD9E5E|nr:RodZ domain-containing protein [Kangiella shandongensis]
MTEKNQQTSDEHGFGPGALLKRTRKEKGLSLDEVSTRLKLTMPVLKQIEADDYESDLPVTFFRGYLKNYAELLKLEEVDIVANFQQYCKQNNLFTTPPPKLQGVELDKPMNSSNWFFKVITAVIILVLVAAIYYVVVEKGLWKKIVGQQPDAEQSSSTGLDLNSETSSELTLPQGAETTSGNELQLNEVAAESESNTVDSTVDEATAADSGESSLTQQPSQAVDTGTTEPVAKPASNPVATSKSLVLSFTGDCWVRIEDSTGKVLALGIKAAGSDLQLSGQPPYRLTLGKASAVQLTYNGEMVDLSGYPDSRAAKLTLGDE